MTSHTMKDVAKKEVKKHEKKMHPKGKKFAKGGKTNLQMKELGRGMAKVINQRSSGRGR